MELKETKTEGGVKIEVTLTAEEYNALDQKIKSNLTSDSARGQKRCCTCIGSGRTHEFEESNDILAAIKCFSKCGGPGFTMSNGSCDG